MKSFFVYMMTNTRKNVLYIGATNNLTRRVIEHKLHTVSGFTANYNCTDLVYFEETPSIKEAISREKQLKKWSRAKKESLIASMNPERRDLSASLEMTGL